MRFAISLLVASGLLGLLAPVSALAQIMPPRIVSSIDVLVLNKETVAVGKVSEVRPGASGEVVIAIDEVLKGKPGKSVSLRQGQPENNRPRVDVQKDQRVLILGDAFTPLTDKGLAVPTAAGTLLRGAKEVRAYIQEVFRTHPNGKTEVFYITAPKKIETATLAPVFDGRRGDGTVLVVPVDSNLEVWARKTLLAGGDGGGNRSKERAFRAMRPFKSDSNIELLRGLLADQNFHSYESDGVEFHVYSIRESAYDLLREWNVAVDKPVLREEITHFKRLAVFAWGSGDAARFDRAVALSKNLKKLYIFDSFQPSKEQLQKIGDIRSLQWLELSGVDKKEALPSIANLVKLEALVLRSVGITDSDIRLLLSLPKLSFLDLSNNPIGDAGLRTLAGIPTLKTVSISRTGVTARGIAEVRGLRPDLVIQQR